MEFILALDRYFDLDLRGALNRHLAPIHDGVLQVRFNVALKVLFREIDREQLEKLISINF